VVTIKTLITMTSVYHIKAAQLCVQTGHMQILTTVVVLRTASIILFAQMVTIKPLITLVYLR